MHQSEPQDLPLHVAARSFAWITVVGSTRHGQAHHNNGRAFKAKQTLAAISYRSRERANLRSTNLSQESITNSRLDRVFPTDQSRTAPSFLTKKTRVGRVGQKDPSRIEAIASTQNGDSDHLRKFNEQCMQISCRNVELLFQRTTLLT